MARHAFSLGVLSIITPLRFAHAQGDSGEISASPLGNWTPEFCLVLIFCAMGFVVLTMQFVLFLRAPERASANDIMRAFLTTLILISVVALVGVGYSERQVQPALGIIGTLLGYLMGKGTLAGDQPSPHAAPTSDDTTSNDRRHSRAS